MHENEIARRVFECGLRVHKVLGPGLLESAYEECLRYELSKSGLFVEQQVILPVTYDDIKLDAGYRIDLRVENRLIVEIKAVEEIHDLHLAQILTYLRLSGCKLGLLINFNTELFRDGVKRVINGTLPTS